MKVSLYNQKAESVGEVEVNDLIFSVKPSIHLLAEAVRVQNSNARKGLAHSKTKGEVSGGGKKPWRQKGTGRARAGSNRSPLWRGGGITFGPRSNRNWELKINKKAKVKALFMTLSDKAKEGKLIIIDSIKLDSVKTKDFLKVITAFSAKMDNLGNKQMFVMPKQNKDLHLASRNIPSINTTLADSLNIKDVLKADSMLILQDSLAIIEKTYLKESAKAKKGVTAKKTVTKKSAKSAKGGSTSGGKTVVKKTAKKVATNKAVAKSAKGGSTAGGKTIAKTETK